MTTVEGDAATAEEAAAIVAAIARFNADTALGVADIADDLRGAGGWLRAARREAVGEADGDALW